MAYGDDVMDLDESNTQSALVKRDTDDIQAPSVLLWDRQRIIPLNRLLSDDDLILLLTPVVVPPSSQQDLTRDPFEALGRAIASRHPFVRHVPYTKRGGITKAHAAFIEKCRVTIFVISGPPGEGEPSQSDLADDAASLGDEHPQIIVACCDMRAYDLRPSRFDTIIQIGDFFPANLEQAASLMFKETKPLVSTDDATANLSLEPSVWPVAKWELHRDLHDTVQLWHECLPRRYHLAQNEISVLLNRDGYVMHYVVRDPATNALVGFCASYITYADRSGERLVGSLALLMVKTSHRGRNIGCTLHDHALQELQKIRGVQHIQLGSTFPRVLHGFPSDMEFQGWFGRRGWKFANDNGTDRTTTAATMREVTPVSSDWLLDFTDASNQNLSTAGLTFRPCTPSDFEQMLALVDRETTRKSIVGWYDQFACLANTFEMEDIMLGFEGDTIVSAALLYTPCSGSPVAADIPWPKSLGRDVGGLTCVCIKDDNPEIVNSRDSIMSRMLVTCIRVLAEQGLSHLFLDAFRGGDEGLMSMGFRRWSRYFESWKRV